MFHSRLFIVAFFIDVFFKGHQLPQTIMQVVLYVISGSDLVWKIWVVQELSAGGPSHGNSSPATSGSQPWSWVGVKWTTSGGDYYWLESDGALLFVQDLRDYNSGCRARCKGSRKGSNDNGSHPHVHSLEHLGRVEQKDNPRVTLIFITIYPSQLRCCPILSSINKCRYGQSRLFIYTMLTIWFYHRARLHAQVFFITTSNIYLETGEVSWSPPMCLTIVFGLGGISKRHFTKIESSAANPVRFRCKRLRLHGF